jgi:hypothetical protein
VKRLAENVVALVLLHSLMSNPERYKYIARLAREGASNQSLTEKNINKAFLMARAFLKKAEGSK